MFISDVGWRDMPLGRPDAEVDARFGDKPYDRCELIRIGPSFGPLGVPVPPNQQFLQDRYRISVSRSADPHAFPVMDHDQLLLRSSRPPLLLRASVSFS